MASFSHLQQLCRNRCRQSEQQRPEEKAVPLLLVPKGDWHLPNPSKHKRWWPKPIGNIAFSTSRRVKSTPQCPRLHKFGEHTTMSAQQRKASDMPATLGELQPLLLPIGDSPTTTACQGTFTITAQSHRLRCSGNSLALMARVGLIVSVFMLAAVPAVISWRNMSSSTIFAGDDRSIVRETNSPENQATVFWTSEQQQQQQQQQQQYPLKERSGSQNFIQEGKYSVHHDLNEDDINARQHTLNKADAAAEELPPNVIFILLDDVGINDIGYTSTDGLASVTPFMDSLAYQGVRISEYYTANLCTPARASLMTGRYTFRYGMQYGELDNTMPWGLPLNEVTLAERFKSAGYATHMVGKWNLGMYTEEYYPFNRGFDSFLGYMGPLETYYSHNRSEHLDFDEAGKITTFKDFGYGDKNGYLDFKTNTTRLGPEMEGKYSTSLTAEWALQVAHKHLAENTTNGTVQPYFMYLAFQAAHTPLDTPADELYTEEELEILSAFTFKEPIRRRFINIMLFLDITLKRMITELDALGMMDNTLLVLSSDNGGCPSGGGSNYPYRGFKHTLFDGGVRAPAFVYSKSTSILPPQVRGTTYEGLMHVTDWTTTLASVTGIPTDQLGEPLDGLDHWPAIVGHAEGDEGDEGDDSSHRPVRTDVVLGCNNYVYDNVSESMLMASGIRGAYIDDGWKINIRDICAGWYSFNDDNIMTDSGCQVQLCPICDGSCDYEGSLNSTFLFHLETDPYEEVNLRADMPEKFAEMEQRLKERCDGEVVPIFKPEDPSSVEKWKAFNDYAVAWK